MRELLLLLVASGRLLSGWLAGLMDSSLSLVPTPRGPSNSNKPESNCIGLESLVAPQPGGTCRRSKVNENPEPRRDRDRASAAFLVPVLSGARTILFDLKYVMSNSCQICAKDSFKDAAAEAEAAAAAAAERWANNTLGVQSKVE